MSTKLCESYDIEQGAATPMQGGPGALASAGRMPLAFLALYELLWVYPGQVYVSMCSAAPS